MQVTRLPCDTLMFKSRNGKFPSELVLSRVNCRFGRRELAASRRQLGSPLTVLTRSSTYPRNIFTWRVSFSLFLARQQLSQYQTISLIDAYTSSDFFPHFRWYKFRQLSHLTPFDLYVTFLLQHGHKPFMSLICCVSVPTGISCLRPNSYSFSYKFARITARDAPIAKPSTCTYH